MDAIGLRLVCSLGVSLLFSLPASGAAAEAAKAAHAKPYVNAAGQAVVAANGQRVNYRKEELLPAPQPTLPLRDAPPAAARTLPAQLANWGWAGLGSSIGLSGLVTAKVGSDTELYAAGSGLTFGGNTYWYSLRWDRVLGRFDVKHVSEQFDSGIRRIVLSRTNAVRSRDQRTRIVVGLNDGTIRLYDQTTKALISSTAGACSGRGGLQALAAADLNGDGADEWLSVCGDQRLVVEDERGNGWSLPGVGGNELVVGQMDDDPALEIATTSGRVIDTASRTVQWTHTQAFGAHLQVADIDGDGRDELIASENWNWVWAYDVERQLPKWSLRADHDIGAIAIADIDGDGVKDLLLGEGQWGRIMAYDTQTLRLKGSIQNPEHGVTQIAVVDLTEDGRAEVIWGAGASSTGPDHLYVADWATAQIRWQNVDLVGPFLGPVMGDLDGDGKPEIVVVSSKSDAGYASGRILVFDASTLALRAISPGVAGGVFAWTAVHDVKLRDIDGDGRMEILIATDWLYDGVIEAYRFNSTGQFSLLWTNLTRPSGAPFHSVEVADVDGDGQMEILGGVGAAHSGAQGAFVYVYSLSTGAEKWHTLHLGGTINSLVLGDFDGNGILNFAAGVLGGSVFIFDAPSNRLDAILTTQSSSLTRLPVTPIPSLIVGRTNGRASVRSFDGGIGYPEVQSLQLGTAPVNGISLASNGDWWVGMAGQLLRFSGGTANFATAAYGLGMGTSVVLNVGGSSGVLSAGAYGLHRFVVQP